MNILIVEDHPINRKLLRAQLEEAGLAVTDAPDGRAALDLLETGLRCDAIVSDILMPRMDGYRLCHEVRRRPALAHLRFILYSSTYTSPEDVKLGGTVGADQFIAKPAPAEQLLGALEIARTLPPARPADLPGEALVLTEYSEALVRKLEEKNAELQESLAGLRRARDELAALNAGLERHVAERTAELQRALDEVTTLRELLPICSYCRQVRTDDNYWETLEQHISRHTPSRFSHGVCPRCFSRHVQPMLDAIPHPAAPAPPSSQ